MASSDHGPSAARSARGVVIPAHPLALTAERKLDERRQAALTRYYCDAGAGGVAVGVHTTQFAIRDPRVGLFDRCCSSPPARSRIRAAARAGASSGGRRLRADGAGGPRSGAARDAGYDLGLLSLAALPDASDDELLAHCRAVAEVIPLCGFYLQPSVGGRLLSYEFWREFCEIPAVVAIKVAPFNRYQTLDVVRAVAEAGAPTRSRSTPATTTTSSPTC